MTLIFKCCINNQHFGAFKMAFGLTKGGILHNFKTHTVICAITELFAYYWPWAHGTFDITCFSHICWSIEPHFKDFVYRYIYSSYVPVLGWKARTAGRQTGTPSWFPALRPHAGLSATPAEIIVNTFYNNIDNIISLQNNILISDLDRKFYAVIKSVHICLGSY